MAITAHTLYAVNVDIAGGSGSDILIDQITAWSIDSGIADLLLGADGAVDPAFIAVGSQAPRVSFSTTALASVLAKCGIDCLQITADADEYGVDCYFQKISEGGTREGGSNHLRLRIAEGLIIPRTITAPHQNGVAEMAMDIVATWDGTNDPVVIAADQALAGSPAVSEAFVAGKVSINGAQLEGVQNITIDFGISELLLGSDGQVWPTFAAIGNRSPRIRITTLDVAAIDTFGLSGTAQGATDSVVWLRKIDEGGKRVSDATAEHISFTIDEGLISVRTIGGSHGAPLMAEVEIVPTYDGTNAILVVDTATAIT